MLSHLNADFLLKLIVINGILIATFLWLYHNYHEISGQLGTMSLTSRSLSQKQVRILKQYFPYYKKLPPRLSRIFEQKLLYFYYNKKYETREGLHIHDRMKLFISAYAAQVSLGFKGYGFSHIEKVLIYPEKFSSKKGPRSVAWELDEARTLHLSWADFFDQMKKDVKLPVGLQIMAHAIKKDENERIKRQIYGVRNLLFHQVSLSDPQAQVRTMFQENDFRSPDDFLEACLKNYLSHPEALRNNFPDLFKKLDHLLYSEISYS